MAYISSPGPNKQCKQCFIPCHSPPSSFEITFLKSRRAVKINSVAIGSILDVLFFARLTGHFVARLFLIGSQMQIDLAYEEFLSRD